MVKLFGRGRGHCPLFDCIGNCIKATCSEHQVTMIGQAVRAWERALPAFSLYRKCSQSNVQRAPENYDWSSCSGAGAGTARFFMRSLRKSAHPGDFQTNAKRRIPKPRKPSDSAAHCKRWHNASNPGFSFGDNCLIIIVRATARNRRRQGRSLIDHARIFAGSA